jgi:DNA-dependent RNA polymerase auxiliary subunit epsilon
MKRCARSNCLKNSIPRGKYCDEHRVGKKKIMLSPSVDDIPVPSVSELERRLLIDDQNREYDETMRLDMIREQEKEQKLIEKAFKESEMDQIRQNVFSYEKTEESFNIKFLINGKQNIHYFNLES